MEDLLGGDLKAQRRKASGEAASPSPGPATQENNGTSTSSVISETEYFLFHKVSKLDTLAGIAIKYNVEVGALKVANGLYSDMSLFARDHVKIPKKKLPPSMYYKPESKSAGGGNGLLQVGAAGGGLAQERAAMSVAMTQLKSYYGTSAGEASDGASSDPLGAGGRQQQPTPRDPGSSFRPSMGKSGIVETIVKKQAESLEQKRNETNVVMGSKDGASAGNGHGSAMAPIRKRGKDEASAGHGAAAKPAAQGGGRRPRGSPKPKDNGLVIRPPLFESKRPDATSASAASGAPPKAPSQKRETFFDRIKKVANKPALAQAPSRSQSGIKLIDLGEAALENPLRTVKSEGVLLAKSKVRKAD
ncbi:LysM domain-containing protein [Chloropicon roscoffensis]|uniref:LysM domain-containing protein n=2 Tax=Chloropicon roscoffensis TaxID=1461544 RepID=A0AAX4P8F9_9CHLO